MSNHEQITAEQVAEFYNTVFFDENDKVKNCKMNLFLESDGRKIIIPGALVNPDEPFHQVVLKFFKRLDENGNIPNPAVAQTTQVAQSPELLDFKKVEYRGNFYFVEQISEEEFKIYNELRTKEISLKSPAAKSILKTFREL